MSILATVENSIELRSHHITHDPAAPSRIDTASAERSRTENKMRSINPSSLTKSRPRLGDSVHHSRYGEGHVLAHWPNGTLLVRFDNEANNRMIWPSFLERPNGQRR
jgi:hypothetical protein